MLVNGKDERIDAGPPDVVHDENKVSGSQFIVNGVSCIACHVQGMYPPPADTVRTGTVAQGNALLQVQRLYNPERLKPLMDRDAEKFKLAVKEAMAPFLKPEELEVADAPTEGAGKNVKDIKPDESARKQLEEPVGMVSRRFQVAELAVEDAAYELGLDDPKRLAFAIEANQALRQLGLGPLASGNTIKREAWDSLKAFNSAFQDAAVEVIPGVVPKRFR
jgi:serine/threonine-protein kinase